MNMLFIKHFFVGFKVSEIPRVSVFGYFPPIGDTIPRYNIPIGIIIIIVYPSKQYIVAFEKYCTLY